MKFEMVHDIVEANGKTIKENNLERTHKIPLNTFVEVYCESSDAHLIRLYVRKHTRDCDGTPLYSLGYYDGEPICHGFSDESLREVE